MELTSGDTLEVSTHGFVSTTEPAWIYPVAPYVYPDYTRNWAETKTLKDFTTREIVAELRKRKADKDLLDKITLPE